MAIEKRFREMLDDNVSQIENHYNQALRDLYHETLDESEEDAIQEEFKERRTKLDARKQKMQDRIDKIHEEMRGLDPEYEALENDINAGIEKVDKEDVDSDLRDFMSSKLGVRSRWSNFTDKDEYKKAHVITGQIVFDSVTYGNYQKFHMIKTNIKNTMNLAATSKEARNILIAFQNKNWRAIGVDLPFLNITNEFEIGDDGNIEMDTSKLLAAPSKKAID